MIILPARRRLIFWLVRAYIKRSGKTILFFFISGIIATLVLIKLLPAIIVSASEKEVYGIAGIHTLEALPLEVQSKISVGLTNVGEDGTTTPGIASSWEVAEDGKVYTLKLREDIYFQDGKKLTADDLSFNFKDATFKVLDKYTIQFTLNDAFSPFLTVLSKPVFKKGLVGVGDYKIKKATFNGSFVSSITLENIHNKSQQIYYFYPTQEALIIAFILGEVDNFKTYSKDKFQDWPNINIEENVSTNELMAIFFNTRDALLSSKSIRQGLIYAIPDTFEEGKTASSPLSFKSFVHTEQSEKFLQSTDKAKELLGEKGEIEINLRVDKNLLDQAKKTSKYWEEVRVKTNIEVVDSVPEDSNYQAFLGLLKIPLDPDQYVLWHSTQSTNISGIADPRIDKLLEDGRKSQDATERAKIYADFQKYLVDDAPAAFLYYPTVYTIKRK